MNNSMRFCSIIYLGSRRVHSRFENGGNVSAAAFSAVSLGTAGKSAVIS